MQFSKLNTGLMITSFLTLGPVAFAQSGVSVNSAETALPSPTQSEPDVQILAEIHAVDQLEIKAGALAASKAKLPEVKAYGKHLVKDHTAADRKVLALAKKQNFDLDKTANTDPKLQAKAKEGDELLEQLKTLKGAEFQAAFVDAMVKGHADMIEDVQKAQGIVKEPSELALLDSILKDLNQHHDKATALSAKVSAAGK